MIQRHVTAEDKRERPYWVVSLFNGESIFQYDFDADGNHVNSWRELKSYVEENKLSIEGAWLWFRDHSEEIGVGKAGYFFIYSVLADAFSGEHRYSYVCGTLEEDGKVHCKKWLVPELIWTDTDVRSIDSLGMKEMLIIND
jgi:hypothetical protein